MSTDANETSEQPFVTDAVMKDLRELVRSYSGPLPGAIGRAGTKLVRLGLARNLGRVTYSGGKYGENPTIYTQFEITEQGKQLLNQPGRDG